MTGVAESVEGGVTRRDAAECQVWAEVWGEGVGGVIVLVMHRVLAVGWSPPCQV